MTYFLNTAYGHLRATLHHKRRPAMVNTDATISGPAPAYLRLAELLMGARITLALRVIVDKNIPDLLGDETKSAAELAPRTGLPIESLRRLMRSLVYAGVFQEDGNGH